MPTKEQLEKSLKSAHAAGDTVAAQRFADEIRRMAGPTAQQEFDALPMWQKPIKALDDLLRVGSDAVTYGGIDHLRTLFGTQPDVETARTQTERARERSGSAGTATAIASSAAPMMLMPALAAPAKAGPVMKPVINTALAALEGSAFGGLDALGHGEDVVEGQLQGAAFGTAGKAISGILGKGLEMAFERGTRGARIEPRDLRLAKDRAYNAMEDERIGFRPTAVDDLLNRIDRSTRDAYPGVQEGVRAARTRARRNLTSGGQGFGRTRTLTEIDKERQNFRRDAVNNPQTTNKELGLEAIRTIDDWLEDATSNPAAVTRGSGDPEVALGMLQEGRRLNQRVEKLDLLDERLGRARRASERNLYTGEDSTIKNNIGAILDDPKKRSQFNADEIEQMELINSGTGAGKVLRQAGRMSPGGGLSWPASTAGGGVGFAIGGVPGAIVGSALPNVVGVLSKMASSRSTRKQAEKLVDMVSSGQSLKKVPGLTARQQRELTRFLTSMGITSEED